MFAHVLQAHIISEATSLLRQHHLPDRANIIQKALQTECFFWPAQEELNPYLKNRNLACYPLYYGR